MTVAAILRDHGGETTLHSELGRGTTLAAWVPAAEGPPVPKAPGPADLPPLQGTVLLVDDEPLVLRSTRDSFKARARGSDRRRRHRRHRDLQAGRSRSIAFRSTPPSSISTCHRSTASKPWRCFARCRRRFPWSSVSGHTDLARKRRLTTLGVIGFLHKPFDVKTLWKMAARALGRAET